MRLALLALVPLVFLAAFAVPSLLSARASVVESAALSSLIDDVYRLERLRTQVAYEQGLSALVVNLRMNPVPGLDEAAVEHLTGVVPSSDLVTTRRAVDDAFVAGRDTPVSDALSGLPELRSRIDEGQATREEVAQTFDRFTTALDRAHRGLLGAAHDRAAAADATGVTRGLTAWRDYAEMLRQSIVETNTMFAFLTPDPRWQSVITRYTLTASAAAAEHGLDAFDGSVPVAIEAPWAALRSSPALAVLDRPPADLLALAGVGRPIDLRVIDEAARAQLVRDTHAAARALDGFVPTLRAHLRDQSDEAYADARIDLFTALFAIAAAVALSIALLVSSSRTIVQPLRRFERALVALRSGAREVPTIDPDGPAEIVGAGDALRRLVDDVALVEAQAAAIGAGQLDNPVLTQDSDMAIGRSLRQSVRTLNTAHAQLRSREETARAILETAADAIWTIDGDALIRSANRATEDLLGWRSVDVVGAHFGSLLATEADMVVFELLRQQGSVRSEVQLRRANGTTVPALVSASVAYFEGDFVFTVVARDITERKELEGRLAHQATHDTLTGLANRGAAITHLEQALLAAQRVSTDTALLFIDLDRFKLVNDSQGHRGGDTLLATVAERLRSLSSATVMPARLGGDEFVVIVSDAPAIDAVVRLGQEVISVIEKSYELNSAAHSISASVGVSYVSAGKATALGMLRDADHAVYQAKQRGGRCVQVFDDELREAVDTRARTEMDLRRAIERNELVLYYQPILDAVTGKLRGAEALVRWQHPTRGLVFPDTFIPLAEESMLIVDLGRWVLRAAMQQVAQWQRASGTPEFSVSVNLSGRHIVDSDVVADVKQLLDQTRADPRRIKIEVTESRLIAEMDSSVRAFQRLRELGIGISIDDFGTGYSGFTNVRSFPIDQVKIDRSFVKHLGVRHQDTAIVETVINLARAFGIDVVAEGVETDQQRLLLIDRSCDLIQGWLVAPAMPLDAFSEWMVRVLPEIQIRFARGAASVVAPAR
jgi:diguanylate cyclase (GGDEF)-like protein/PAS domain S-box-containing protein